MMLQWHDFALRIFLTCIWIGCEIVGDVRSEETVRVSSPGGAQQVRVMIDKVGAVTYSVMYRGQTIVRPSRLGLHLDSQADFDTGFVFQGKQLRQGRGTLKSRLAERASAKYSFNELSLVLKDKKNRALHLVFRLFDEAIAFRYEILEQKQLGRYAITGELTEFRLSAAATVYTEHGHEGKYVQKPISEVRIGCELPLFIQDRKAALYHLISQADAWDYSRRYIRSKQPAGTLGFTLAGKVKAKGSFVTPWHVLSTAKSAGTLIEQNYIRDALVGDRAEEPDWIIPGKVIRLLDLTTKGGMEGVDFAAKNGLQYVEFDASWYGSERDPKADASTPRNGLNVEAVCQYGRKKGIGALLYVNKIHLRKQLAQILPIYQKWGVKGLKFGFVDGRSQSGIAEVHRWTKAAMRHRMIVDVHDNYRPTGISQRLPNLLTQEGIRGNEWMPTSRHNATLPFTRFVVGAGDYTICYQIGRVKATNAHQLALSVICFSPLQFVYWYGRPPQYAKSMGKEWFKMVPTTWEETRVITGEVGKDYAVARRNGSAWFLGAITNESARTLSLPLRFLEKGVKYQAVLYRDAEGKELEIKQQEVTAKSILKERLRANGGVAIVIRSPHKHR